MPNLPTTQRLDKYLANRGVIARRKVVEFLATNKVTINGKRVTEPGERFDPQTDILLVNKKPLEQPQHLYYLLNKPKGVISSSHDENDRLNVTELVDSPERLYPVGRLDQDSYGLVLLTNDGDVAYVLTHPKFQIPKTYQVHVNGHLTDHKIHQLETGIELKDGLTSPAKIELLEPEDSAYPVRLLEGEQLFNITIHEGRNRQVRRMCAHLNLAVINLTRHILGPLKLGRLRPGESRPLTSTEVTQLKQLVTKLNPPQPLTQ